MVNWEDAFFEYLLNILGIKNYCDYVTPAGPLADSYYCLSISAETLSLNATPLKTVDGNFMLMFNLAGVIWSDLTGSNFVHVVLTQEPTESYSLDHAIDISSKNSVRKKED